MPYLITLGTDPNAQNHYGMTPMHECVAGEADDLALHPKCLEALLACGKADTAIANKAGLTPEQCIHALLREVELGYEARR